MAALNVLEQKPRAELKRMTLNDIIEVLGEYSR